MESVLNMTKDISNNKAATDSSISATHYPADETLETDTEKKTVSNIKS